MRKQTALFLCLALVATVAAADDAAPWPASADGATKAAASATLPLEHMSTWGTPENSP